MTRPMDDPVFDRQLAAWLSDEAGALSPEYLDETLARVDGVRQRRAWASLERWLPMTVITARPLGAPWRLAWTLLVLSLVGLTVAGLVIVGSVVSRPDPVPDLQGTIPTLQLEETWHRRSSPTATFDEPMVGDVDADGNLYLVNGGTNHVLVLDPTGQILHRHGLAGVPGFDFQDHPEDPFGWTSNGSVAVGPDGAIYVASIVDRRIYRFAEADGWTSWGRLGSGDGEFARPSAVAVAPDGTVHVRDGQRKDVQRFDPDGTYLGTIDAREAPDGTRLGTGFMAFDADGGSYVAEYDGDRLQAWDPDGDLRWAVPVTGTSDDEFAHPRDVAVDSHGNVYVTHTGVQVYSPDGRLMSEWVPPAEPTEVGIGPIHVAVGPDDTVYVSLQMLDTIYKLRVVMAAAEPLGAALAPPVTADAPAEVVLPSPPSVQASLLTVPFRDFAVPFELDLPSGGWGVSRVGASVVEVGTSQPAGGGDPAWVHAFIVDEVIADPCNPSVSGSGAASSLTVEGVVDALTRLEGFRVIDVSDVKLDGHAGKVVALENSLDTSACERDPWLPQWTYLGPSGQPIQHGPVGNTLQRVIVLDVDGRLVVIEAWTFPFTSLETMAEVERMIDSLRFL